MITLEDIDAMEDGMGEAKRYKDSAEALNSACERADKMHKRAQVAEGRIKLLERELAAERALADALHKLWVEAASGPKYWSKEEVDADAAYCKARGL